MSTEVAITGSPEHGQCAGVPSAGSALPQSLSIAGIDVCVLTSPAQLMEIRDHWDTLTQATADPNPFYSSLPFFSAIDFLLDDQWQVISLWKSASHRKTKELVGLFPLVQKRTPGILPLRYWSFINHGYSFLTTPLLAKGYETDCFNTLLTYLRETSGPGIVEFPLLNSDGPAYFGLVEAIRDRQQAIYRIDEFSRAMLHRSESDAETYIQRAIGGHSLREIRRNYRRICESGTVEFRSMTPDSAKNWSDWFLELEASGWKGNNGTALRNADPDQRFFRTIVREGARTGVTEMCGLFLNGEPIALKCNLLSAPGASAFKIAYREDYAKFSPGIQLELENIRRFWDKTELHWMDSCAVPKHPMINRLWLERRPIQHLLISTGRVSSEFMLSAMPLFRTASRMFKRGMRTLSAPHLETNSTEQLANARK